MDCPICGKNLSLLDRLLGGIVYAYNKSIKACRKCTNEYNKKKYEYDDKVEERRRKEAIEAIKKGEVLDC